MALSLMPLKAAEKNKSLRSLKKDPNKLFNLPDFLEYKIVARNGEAMSDGLQTPPRPDGMACFQNNDGTITLIKITKLAVEGYQVLMTVIYQNLYHMIQILQGFHIQEGLQTLF